MRDNAKSGALTEVTFFVLLALYEPRHGYAIMQFIEEKTDGRLILGAGSLYGAMESLCKKGWIELHDDSDVRRKEYIITDLGRRIAKQELVRLREVARIAQEITGGTAV